MTVVIVIVVLVVACFIGCIVWASSRSPSYGPPPTEAELLRARLDLHRASRGVDVALAGLDTRREAEATKQAIADALEVDAR